MPINFDGFVEANAYAHDVYPDNVILVRVKRNYSVFYLPAAVMKRLESLDAAERVDLHFDNDKSVIFDFHENGQRKCFRVMGTACRGAKISGAAIITGRFEDGQKFEIQEVEQADDHVCVLAIAEEQAG